MKSLRILLTLLILSAFIVSGYTVKNAAPAVESGSFLTRNDSPTALAGYDNPIYLSEDSYNTGAYYLNLSSKFTDTEDPYDLIYRISLSPGGPFNTTVDTAVCTLETPANSTLKINTKPDMAGQVDLYFNVTDSNGSGLEPPNAVPIVISGVNDGPVINSLVQDETINLTTLDHKAAAVVQQDAQLKLVFTAFDRDGSDSLYYDIEITDTSFELWSESLTTVKLDNHNSTGIFLFTPGNSQVGTLTLNISVTDYNVKDWVVVTIIVQNVNDPPLIGSIYLSSVYQYNYLNETITASDADLDINVSEQLTFTCNISDSIPYITKGADWDLDPVTGEFWFHPVDQRIFGTDGYSLDYPVQFRVTDKAGAYSVFNTTITVRNVNDPPPEIKDFTVTIEDLDTSTTEVENLVITVEAPEITDPDGDYITYEWDFGDYRPYQRGRVVEYEYYEGGTYEVRLLYSDGFVTGEVSKYVVVTAPRSNEAEWWYGFYVSDKLEDSDLKRTISVAWTECSIDTTTERSGRDYYETTTTTTLRGTCGTDVSVIHIYNGNQYSSDPPYYYPYYDQDTWDYLEIEPFSGRWEWTYSTTYESWTYYDDDVYAPEEPPVKTNTQWYCAVAWDDKAYFNFAESEAEETTSGTPGDDDVPVDGDYSTNYTEKCPGYKKGDFFEYEINVSADMDEFDFGSFDTLSFKITVTGSETITVGGKSVDCWKIVTEMSMSMDMTGYMGLIESGYMQMSMTNTEWVSKESGATVKEVEQTRQITEAEYDGSIADLIGSGYIYQESDSKTTKTYTSIPGGRPKDLSVGFKWAVAGRYNATEVESSIYKMGKDDPGETDSSDWDYTGTDTQYFEVLDEEKITVPAGTFDVFKVKKTDYPGDNWDYEYVYLTSDGVIVKMEEYESGDLSSQMRLSSYKFGGKEVGVDEGLSTPVIVAIAAGSIIGALILLIIIVIIFVVVVKLFVRAAKQERLEDEMEAEHEEMMSRQAAQQIPAEQGADDGEYIPPPPTGANTAVGYAAPAGDGYAAPAGEGAALFPEGTDASGAPADPAGDGYADIPAAEIGEPLDQPAVMVQPPVQEQLPPAMDHPAEAPAEAEDPFADTGDDPYPAPPSPDQMQ